jgi:hypothetical protein
MKVTGKIQIARKQKFMWGVHKKIEQKNTVLLVTLTRQYIIGNSKLTLQMKDP